jgi:flagellar basal body P-ring formation protein FlgA
MHPIRMRHPAIVLLAICWCCSKLAAGVATADDRETTILVPRMVIYPGDVISDDSVVERQVTRKIGEQKIFGESRTDVIGKVARRTLLRGEAIVPSALRGLSVIIQGRTYPMIYKSDILMITGTGVPLQSAAAGQVVNVRNPDTGAIVKARARDDGSLVVELQ